LATTNKLREERTALGTFTSNSPDVLGKYPTSLRVALRIPDLKLASYGGRRNLVVVPPEERARNDEPACLTEDDDAKPMGVDVQATGAKAPPY
jgi:hypothetical protein